MEATGDGEVVVNDEAKENCEVEAEGEGTMEGGFAALMMENELASTLLSLPSERGVVANRCAIGNGIGSFSTAISTATEGGGMGSSTRRSGLDCFVPSLKNLVFRFGAVDVDER